jgi:NTE family protein
MPQAMACVATRRSDGNAIAFTAGDAGLAVQASSAIEGRFTPVRINGEQYVDPDWSAPLPVRIARALGAQRVLAVDATVHLDRAPAAAERFRAMDLRKKALVDLDVVHADLVLKPDFGYWVNLSTEFRQRAIDAGYRATLAQAPALRRLHGL